MPAPRSGAPLGRWSVDRREQTARHTQPLTFSNVMTQVTHNACTRTAIPYKVRREGTGRAAHIHTRIRILTLTTVIMGTRITTATMVTRIIPITVVPITGAGMDIGDSTAVGVSGAVASMATAKGGDNVSG